MNCEQLLSRRVMKGQGGSRRSKLFEGSSGETPSSCRPPASDFGNQGFLGAEGGRGGRGEAVSHRDPSNVLSDDKVRRHGTTRRNAKGVGGQRTSKKQEVPGIDQWGTNLWRKPPSCPDSFDTSSCATDARGGEKVLRERRGTGEEGKRLVETKGHGNPSWCFSDPGRSAREEGSIGDVKQE